jgi:hypothetical protein
MICGTDDILAKPTNDNGKIANGSLVGLVCLEPLTQRTAHLKLEAKQTKITPPHQRWTYVEPSGDIGPTQFSSFSRHFILFTVL